MVATKSKFLVIVCLGFMLAFLSGCVPSGQNEPENIPVPTPQVGDKVYTDVQSAIDRVNPAGYFQDFDIPEVTFEYTGVENIYFVKNLPQTLQNDRDLSVTLLYYYEPPLSLYSVGRVVENITDGWSQGVFYLIFLVLTIPIFIGVANIVVTKSQLTYSHEFEIDDLVSGIKKIVYTLVYRVNVSDEEESTAFSEEKVIETLIPYLVDKIVKFAAEWQLSQQQSFDMTKFIRDLDVMFEKKGYGEIDDFIRNARLGITVIGLNRGNPVWDASEQSKSRLRDIARSVRDAMQEGGLSEETMRAIMDNQTRSEGNDAMAGAIGSAASAIGGVLSAASMAAVSKLGANNTDQAGLGGVSEQFSKDKPNGGKK